MQSIRVAAVSMNGGLGVPHQSLERIDTWAGAAAEQGADLALFPELVVHGHCTPATFELAEPVPDGPSTRRLVQIARERGIIVSAGLSEKDRDIVYNAQVLAGPDGFIGCQRKIHMSRDEGNFYKGGTRMDVFDVGKCRAGTVICYDNALPEVARIVALRGAEVILAPHAARIGSWDDTPQSEAAARHAVREAFLEYRLRARENACFYVVADQAGRAGTVDAYPRNSPYQPHHPGGALILGPEGQILAGSQTQKIRDEMIVATLDCADLSRARSQVNYTLRTRRPELFKDLASESV